MAAIYGSTGPKWGELLETIKTLSAIDKAKLQGGNELRVDANKLIFSKPWIVQKLSAWSSSTALGFSERDEKVQSFLKTWFQELKDLNLVQNQDTTWQIWEVETFEKAFFGLIELGKSYLARFLEGKDKYSETKRQTAEVFLRLAREYRIDVLQKVQPRLNSDEVSAKTKELMQIFRKYFPKLESAQIEGSFKGQIQGELISFDGDAN